MKLAIVQDWLTNFGGGEQVVLALHEMYPDAPIYTSLYNPEGVPQFAKADIRTSYLQHFRWLRTHHQVAIPLMPAAFESLDLKEFDVVLSIGTGLSKGVITHPHQRHISYNHTPIRYIWNLGGDNRADGWLRRKIAHKLRLWDVVSAERVDQFIGNSNTVCKRIEKIYRQPAVTVYPPVNVDRYVLSTELVGDYFITVGRLIGYKRFDLIIDGCMQAGQRLKVVGNGPELENLKRRCVHSPLIEFVGRLEESALHKLYGGAKAFIFAAEEDFGIVPVEAMACGRPVIAYGKGGATETVEEGLSGTFFHEQTAESLAAVLRAFDVSRYNPEKIRERALRFSKQRFQDEMRKIIEFQS